MAHTMMENRNGLVDMKCAEFSGRAEVETTVMMFKRTAGPGSTVGADNTAMTKRPLFNAKSAVEDVAAA